jgi:hypothetical protein
LIQCVLLLLVGKRSRVSLLAYSIDLIDENDAWGRFGS